MMQSVDDLLSQLRPITGPEAVAPMEETNWLAIVGGVIAGILIFLLFFRWLRRVEKPLSPRDEAVSALHQLPNEPGPAALAALDHLARRWLGRVHNLDSEHVTGRELLHRLPQSVAQSWSAIFAQLEPGRFSTQPLTATQWRALINEVRELVTVDLAGSVAE